MIVHCYSQENLSYRKNEVSYQTVVGFLVLRRKTKNKCKQLFIQLLSVYKSKMSEDKEASEDVIEPIKISIEENKLKTGTDVVDGVHNDFTSKRNVAEGMMDIALLTANANQLRLVLMLNTTSTSFYICAGLIVFSLMLQVIIGFGLIYKVSVLNSRQSKRVTFQF